MHCESKIVEIIRARQAAIRRELDRRQISMKAVSQDSLIAYGTLLTYFPADHDKHPVQIPGSAVFALANAIPSDLLSLLLPDGFQVIRAPEDINHDDFSALVTDYMAALSTAHRVDSPAGPAIAPCEQGALDAKVAQIRGS